MNSVSTDPATDINYVESASQTTYISGIQNGSLSTPPAETLLPHGGSAPLNGRNFAAPNEADTALTGQAEVHNDTVATPPELTTENDAPPVDPVVEKVNQWLLGQLLTPPDSPAGASTSLGPIRKTKYRWRTREDGVDICEDYIPIARRRYYESIGVELSQYTKEVDALADEIKHSFNLKSEGASRIRYECNYPDCNTACRLRNLAEHILVCHRARSPVCDACGYKASSANALRRHRNYRSESQKGTCRICKVCRYRHTNGEIREDLEKICQRNCVEWIRKENEQLAEKAAETTTSKELVFYFPLE